MHNRFCGRLQPLPALQGPARAREGDVGDVARFAFRRRPILRNTRGCSIE
jgi:hypothetical protein